MKNRLIILGIISILCMSVIKADSEEDFKLTKNVQKFFEYRQSEEEARASYLFANEFSAKDMENFVQYIDIHPETVPPIFYIASADYYIYTKNPDKAALWFYVGRLRAEEDIWMCKDKTASSQFAAYNQLAPGTVKYLSKKLKDKKYALELLKNVLTWDEEHPQRIGPIWACYHGIEAFEHEPELLPESDFPKIKQYVRGKYQASVDELEGLKKK